MFCCHHYPSFFGFNLAISFILVACDSAQLCFLAHYKMQALPRVSVWLVCVGLELSLVLSLGIPECFINVINRFSVLIRIIRPECLRLGLQ